MSPLLRQKKVIKSKQWSLNTDATLLRRLVSDSTPPPPPPPPPYAWKSKESLTQQQRSLQRCSDRCVHQCQATLAETYSERNWHRHANKLDARKANQRWPQIRHSKQEATAPHSVKTHKWGGDMLGAHVAERRANFCYAEWQRHGNRVASQADSRKKRWGVGGGGWEREGWAAVRLHALAGGVKRLEVKMMEVRLRP